MSRYHYGEAVERQDLVQERPAPNGYYGTYASTIQRDTNRIKLEGSHPSSSVVHSIPQPTHSVFRQASEESYGSCQTCLEGILRPCFAEFLAVYVTMLISTYVSSELSDRHVMNIHRISLVSLLDAIVALIFISAFKTVHLHPAITLANLFSLSTSWILCCLLIIMQLLGSCLAIATISLALGENSPNKIDMHHDIISEWNKTIYKLMISQLIGTAMVVMSHLMVYSPEQVGDLKISKLKESPLSLFMAIAVSSFLSLLQSTVNWNCLQASAVAFVSGIYGIGSSQRFHELLLFWLGPVIGSLLACFMFRLLYASDDRRMIHCSCCGEQETSI